MVTENDEVLLQWVCTQDIEVLDQRNKDIQLVQLSQTIQDLQLDTKAQMVKTTDKGMENEVDETDGEGDEMNASNYEDSTEK